jgi:hypothetical protein
MTRAPYHRPIHVVPIAARGNHRPSPQCPCHPIEAVDLMDGPLGTVYYVHRHARGDR